MKVFILLLLIAFQGHALIRYNRCETNGDSLDNAEQAAGRRAWVSNCLEHESGAIEMFAKVEQEGKVRDAYPTFMMINRKGEYSNPEKWFAPTDPKAPCYIPNGYKIVHGCLVGCYTPEQAVLFATGYTPIGMAYEKDLPFVFALAENATLEHPTLVHASVAYYLTDILPGDHDILEISMFSGGFLSVTPNHPLIDGTGYVRSAGNLRVGDNLVTESGNLDRIVSIMPGKYFGKVYNLEVSNPDPAQKIIVAQGYLNGTAYYQNEGLKDLNRLILRNHLIPDDLVK